MTNKNDLTAFITQIQAQSNEIKEYIISILSYLIDIRDAIWNIILCAKGTNDTVGVLRQGKRRVYRCDIVGSRGRHCEV